MPSPCFTRTISASARATRGFTRAVCAARIPRSSASSRVATAMCLSAPASFFAFTHFGSRTLISPVDWSGHVFREASVSAEIASCSALTRFCRSASLLVVVMSEAIAASSLFSLMHCPQAWVSLTLSVPPKPMSFCSFIASAIFSASDIRSISSAEGMPLPLPEIASSMP